MTTESEIELHQYQENAVSEINRIFETKNKVLFQLPTGGGKTFCFSFFTKLWCEKHKNAKVLLLVHREELLDQSAKSLREIGVTVETLTSKKNKLNHLSKCYVCMVETANNRLKKDPEFFKDITLIIADECHLLLFERVFDFFENVKILGVSATPSSYKKINFSKCARCGNVADTTEICCNTEMYEYTRNFTFSEIYDEIVSPVQISELIEMGYLVKELNYSAGSIQRENLKIDSKTGDFDTKSSDEEFGKSGSVLDVVLNYEKICKGQKTLIFNNSTSTNLLVYNAFKNAGYDNVKMLDSVNVCENRKSVLLWFKNTPDAILLNCGILTAGFDEETIQSIIMNRATTSLMLYIQCAGRGSRTTTKIFKDRFTFIDLGGNIEAHGKFSDNIDWVEKFYGTDQKPKAKKEALEQIKQCTACGYVHAKNLLECPECGHKQPERKMKTTLSNEVAKLIDPIPLPDGYKIAQYTQKNGKDVNFAYRVLINQLLDLFYYYNVTEKMYIKSLKNGEFYNTLKEKLVKPNKSFAIFFDRKSLKSFDTIIKIVKVKLDTYYKIENETEITIIKKL